MQGLGVLRQLALRREADRLQAHPQIPRILKSMLDVYNFIFIECSSYKIFTFSSPAPSSAHLLRSISEYQLVNYSNISGNVAKKTVNPGKVVNEKSIEWNESLTLPLLYNR